MDEAEPADQATLFPKTAGERLREAREAQGVSLAEIAARTRIPIRQLEAIEVSDFAALPSVTYSVGFAKAYARAVGVDEVSIGKEVRGQNDQGVRRTEYEAYEMPDPSRVPSNGLAIAGVVAAVILVIAIGLWYGTSLFRGEENAAQPVATEIGAPAATAVAPPPPAPTTGQVSLTATDTVWLRVYDATGKSLYENTLKPGERYDVPADANGPMINVGRPDQLQVTLNGSLLPALGTGERAIKDVGISAAALTARPATGTAMPTAGASGSASPRARPTAKPSSSVTIAVPPAFSPSAPTGAPSGAATPAP